jgi:hypothetical protein
MSDHWWWRPGVRPDRRLLVWHILFDEHANVRELVAECQDRLDGVAGFDLIPAEWLHMTTQIIGFEDEISSAEIEAMTAAVTGCNCSAPWLWRSASRCSTPRRSCSGSGRLVRWVGSVPVSVKP